MKNRCNLRCCLNAVNDEAEVASSGSVFQMRSATGKAREPMEVRRTARTIRLSEVEDRGVCSEKGLSDTDELPQILWYDAGKSTVRQDGNLYVMCSESDIRNQCKLTSASVM